jgi:hypothetical protein
VNLMGVGVEFYLLKSVLDLVGDAFFMLTGLLSGSSLVLIQVGISGLLPLKFNSKRNFSGRQALFVGTYHKFDGS